MPKRVRSLRCPTCRKIVTRGEPEYPFCSERCRLIDLGKWASGGYVVSTPIHEADQFGEADYTVNPGEGPQSKPNGKTRNRS
jgi:endogenous inhibitor of DNA gyrase (YacG/DUF329 family)